MHDNLDDLILDTQQQLQISAYAIEKDYYVSQALFALTAVQDERLQLVFKGGTCLAKAHKIIHRMSEDCDFRIARLPISVFSSKQSLRNHTRDFRHTIQSALKNHGFIVAPENITVGNEGQFMQIRLNYATKQPQHSALRPHILLEFFQADLKTNTLQLPVTSLIKETLGSGITHPTSLITCISLEETFAEKWVALLRRGSLALPDDNMLVRHLYDIYKLADKIPVASNSPLINLIAQIIEEDRLRFKNLAREYFDAPIDTLRKTLDVINRAPIWQKRWQEFINAMVFHFDRTDFETVIERFNLLSNEIFSTLSNKTSTIYYS